MAGIRLFALVLILAVGAWSGAALAQDASAEDPRRKVYELTGDGRALVQAEAERLARVLEVARERRIIGGGGQ